MKVSVDRRTIGVNFRGGRADVLVWAPMAKDLYLLICGGRSFKMQKEGRGYWSLSTPDLQAGMDYKFELHDGTGKIAYPNPASLSQPDGVHGPSRAVDLKSFDRGTKDSWRGIPLSEYIIYELHVGTFTEEGTFDGVISRLQYLKLLGITAIELMPVVAFPGERNWGYDGVFPFAVHDGYGGQAGLRRLVNACHELEIAVIVDVVYNHLGPEGNYLPVYGNYFTDKYSTPWGKALNFDDADSDEVRFFFAENILMWFRDIGVDALRLDAVHAIKDMGARHILAEMRSYLEELNKLREREFYLIVECDLNDPKYINRLCDKGYGMNAQWCDEFHHALRVAAGQEKEGYYSDFTGVEHLAKAFADAYVYDGIYSEERRRTFGAKAGNPASSFVVFSQNHDQVGNRMLGERSAALYGARLAKVLAGAVITAPYIPLLFMGEEYGETNPFLYFVSHGDPELIEAVRKGRAEEFKHFISDKEAPDPQSEDSFIRSRLQWELPAQESSRTILQFYKDLISLRKSNAILRSMDRFNLKAVPLADKNSLLVYRWIDGEQLVCVMNFSSEPQDLDVGEYHYLQKIIDSGSGSYGGNEEVRPDLNNPHILHVPAQSFSIFSYV